MEGGGGGGGGGYQPTYHQWEPGRVRPKRPVTDYGSTMVHWMRQRRPLYKQKLYMEMERPSASYIQDMVPPLARPGNAADSLPVKHLHSSLNKIKFPINVALWTPEGRRLLTASSNGEFTVWNGMGFNFETIMQAHDAAIMSASYSHDGQWLLSADRGEQSGQGSQDGLIKYFTSNFNNVKVIESAHAGGVKGVSFAPTDAKFVTGGDDARLKIFDFALGTDELTLSGHQWEVRCVDWHPHKGLIVSGSKDHLVKLWDPRSGRCLTTLSSSKQSISRTLFEPTQGTYLATSGRDQIIRIFDLRMMRDVFHLRGHDHDVTSLAWHPIHRNLLSSGGHSGAINHYLLDEPNTPSNKEPTLSPYDSPHPETAQVQNIYPAHSIPYAHEQPQQQGSIWSLAWHPLGHILASGANDRITRFWTRARPGDDHVFSDRYHVGQAAAEAHGNYDRRDGRKQLRDEEEQEAQDEAEGLVDQQMPAKQPGLPGLPGLDMALPGIGAAMPSAPLPGGFPDAAGPLAALPPGMFAGMDPSKIDVARLAEMFGGQLPQFPPPGAQGAPLPFPPPPPPGGLPGMPPLPPPHMFPNGLPPPGAFPGGFPPPPLPGMPGMPGLPQGGSAGEEGDFGARRRAPLPSQKDSLREELKRGRGGGRR